MRTFARLVLMTRERYCGESCGAASAATDEEVALATIAAAAAAAEGASAEGAAGADPKADAVQVPEAAAVAEAAAAVAWVGAAAAAGDAATAAAAERALLAFIAASGVSMRRPAHAARGTMVSTPWPAPAALHCRTP